MQDHGVAVEDFENRSTMETSAPNPPVEAQISALGLPFDVDANTIKESSCGVEETNNPTLLFDDRLDLSNEQVLPKHLSSDYENISLNPAKEAEAIPSYDDSNGNGCLENEKEGIPEKNVCTENSEFEDEAKSADNVHSYFPLIAHAEVSPEVPQNPPNEGESWKNFDSNPGEPSIEESCELQPTYNHDSTVKERATISETPEQQISGLERRPTINDDSRLVKISLPTSTMNIMQTNAQFLNKSRNFFNFITEKSTNIMEKTLLPQNLAVRYGSAILKYTEPSVNPIERKTVQESSVPTESSTNTVSDSKLDENSEHSQENSKNGSTEGKESSEDTKNHEFVQDSTVYSIGDFSMDCQSAISASEFLLTEENDSLRLKTDFSHTSEIIPKTNNLDSENLIDVDKELLGIEKAAVQESIETNDSLHDLTNSLLRHPVYLTLVRDYAKTREEKIKLAERVENLEAKNRMLEAGNSSELFNVQLEALEKTVERLTNELRGANANQEELGREYAAANKERENMVMKYAVSEKQLIDTQRARDYAERRYKEIAKDYELLQNKLRQAQSEKTRICNILDTKCRELTDSQKEVERLKEEVNVRDVKLKWTQTKLKSEMESQKETQSKLDRATARINDMREECEQVRRESQEMIRKFQHSEENKAVSLDQQLKEQQARLILERHVTEDKEILRLQLQKEVDLLKNRQLALIEENNTLSLKIQDLEKSRLAYESKLSDLKNLADQRQKEIVDLSAKVSHFETLKLQLIHKEQCLVSNEAEVERLRQVNQELQADMDCCRQREAHMLEFTQKLTDKNVRLQSEFTAIEAKSAQLEKEQGPLRESIAEYKSKVKTLEENLAFERKKRTEECEILARHLAEQTQIVKNLTQKLEESEGEIVVLRRKQQISVKEMSRELQLCRKKLEAYENASPSNSLDPTSRTGSNNSLNAGETLNGASSDNSGNGDATLQSAELDRQSLIDRILKMQKINVRRAEKLDFLEEHTRTLVAELQKKTKIIQNYILHENFDAMGSNERDRHKAELARYGGIMASVYSHRVSDDNMTLELSLEINQKLQTVLEDALLKNITLKDNIDTLGEEIARLTIMNQQLLQQKGK